VAAIDAGEEKLVGLESALKDADKAYVKAAKTLSAGRRKAAQALDAAVQAELPPLKLERARFITEISTDEDSRDPSGFERVEFWAQTNPGTRPGPLMKVASGGELSRFMLALKLVLAKASPVSTLVFDEVDSGIGGGVAEIVGRRLRALGNDRQVLAVTHLPQVASQAHRHVLVTKREVNGRSRIQVETLTGDAKLEELARMLGGVEITQRTRAHAREMLERGRRD